MILPKWLFDEIRKTEHAKGFEEGYNLAIDNLCFDLEMTVVDKDARYSLKEFKDWLQKYRK